MNASLCTLAAALLGALVVLPGPLPAQSPPGSGKVDAAFTPTRDEVAGVGHVRAMTVLTDCGLLVSGGGSNIRKLNFNGSPDLTFNVPFFNNTGVGILVREADGKIIAGGDFSAVSYVGVLGPGTAAGLARFNEGGDLDMSTPFPPIAGVVYSLLVLPGGKILVGGSFVPAGRSLSERALARYLPTGELDPVVPPNIPSGDIRSMALQTIGGVDYVIIAGSFNSVGGVARGGGVARLRLDDLTLDPAFVLRSAPAPAPAQAPYLGPGALDSISVAVQLDNKVVVAGQLAPRSGATRNIYRFAADGLVDPSFSAPAMTSPLPGGTWIESLLVQPDSKAIIGGRFEALNGVSRRYVARLNPNGTLDSTFNPGTGASAASPIVYSLALLPSGNVMVGGAIDSFNGVPTPALPGLGVVRLFGDALATTCLLPARTLAVSLSASGEDAGGTVRVQGGSVDTICSGPAPCNLSFPHGTIVTLTALPNPLSELASWSGPGFDPEFRVRRVALLGNAAVSANFIRQYQLEVTVASPGHGGQVKVEVAPTSSGSTTFLGIGTEAEPFNQRLSPVNTFQFFHRLTALPAPGHDVSWSGPVNPGGPSLVQSVTLTADRRVTTTFLPRPRTVVVNVQGSGSVVSAPAGINCPGPAPCEHQFPPATTEVTLTANPNMGWAFEAWTDLPPGTPGRSHPGRSVMTPESPVQNVTAKFVQKHALTLNFQLLGAFASGMVGTAVVTPPGEAAGDDDFSCSTPPAGASCARDYVAGTVVKLRATPGSGTGPARWFVNGTLTPPDSGDALLQLTVILDSPKTITAQFFRPPTPQLLTVIPSGPGTVVSCPFTGINCFAGSSGGCAANFDGNISLLAMPDAGHVVLWSVNGDRVPGIPHTSGGGLGDCPTGNRLDLTMDGPKTVQAEFKPLRRLEVNVVGPGQVTIAPQTVPATAPVTCGPCSPRDLPETTVVGFTAVYDPALVQFTGWGEDLSGTAPTETIVMDDHKTITATFVALPPTVSAISPAADPVLAGRSDLTLSVPAPGGLGPFTYQWQKRAGPTQAPENVGPDAAEYLLPDTALAPAHEGAQYRVRVSNDGGTTDSGWWTLTFQRDFGDAPPPYLTRLADNGPRHILWAVDHARDLRLGLVDAEADAPAPLGTDGDDESGVVAGPIFRGLTGKVTVYPNQAGGYLDAWIDFNNNGDWGDSGEQIATARSVAAGLDEFTFPVPSDAVPGQRVARFRISSTGGLATTGGAKDGEVEDHLVPVLASPIAGLPAPLTVPKNHPPLNVPFCVAASFSSFTAPVSPTVEVVSGGTLLASAPTLSSSGSSGDFEGYDLVLSPAADLHGEAELVITAMPDGGGSPITAPLTLRIVDALDADGVADGVEDGVPNLVPPGTAGSGDGNGDGQFDRSQLEVASLPNATPAANYVTLVAEHVFGGVRLVDVQALDPTPLGTAGLEPGTTFPEGLVRFRVEGVPPLLPVAKVSIIYHSGFLPSEYWKHGPTADNPTPHWHRMPAYPVPAPAPGSATDFGVEFDGNKVILHLVDGGFGDADGEQNGVIQDPGGPVVLVTTPPALSIEMLPGQQARISWPEAGSAGLVLKSADSLTPPVPWQTDPATVTTDAGFKRAVVDLLGGARFYRLAQP